MTTTTSRLTTAWGAIALAGCLGEPATEEGDAEILGGIGARSAQLQAVGAIGELVSDANGGTFFAKCSGTLIGPHTVLTASHCVQKYKGRDSIDYTEMFFRIGYDAARPDRIVRIVGGKIGPNADGGLTGRGADVGLFYLAEDVEDVTPIAVSTTLLTADDLGDSFTVVGYGQQRPQDPVGNFRKRQLGRMTLATLSGDPAKQLWRSLDDLVAWVNRNLGANTTAAALASFWDSPTHVLMEGKTAFFSELGNGAMPCLTDSGGPLLRRRDGRWEVVAITSGVYQLTVSGVSACWGGTYAGLVAEADMASFISTNLGDRCRGVPAAGTCNADTAIQCNGGTLTAPISVYECGTDGMRCARPDDGLACVDDGTPTAPASDCSMAGTWINATGVPYVFRADGTYTVRGAVRGRYALEQGVLRFDDTAGSCVGATSGFFVPQFASGCGALTFDLVRDGCRLRGEGLDTTGLTWVDPGTPEVEPNGTFETAQSLPGSIRIAGTVTTGDDDVFAVALKAGETLTADDSTLCGADTVFFVYGDPLPASAPTEESCDDPTAPAPALACDDDGGASFCSHVAFTAPADGTYFLRVIHFGHHGTGQSYLLDVSVL